MLTITIPIPDVMCQFFVRIQDIYNNNNNNNNIYLLQLGCHPMAVVILHVNKT